MKSLIHPNALLKSNQPKVTDILYQFGKGFFLNAPLSYLAQKGEQFCTILELLLHLNTFYTFKKILKSMNSLYEKINYLALISDSSSSCCLVLRNEKIVLFAKKVSLIFT